MVISACYYVKHLVKTDLHLALFFYHFFSENIKRQLILIMHKHNFARFAPNVISKAALPGIYWFCLACILFLSTIFSVVDHLTTEFVQIFFTFVFGIQFENFIFFDSFTFRSVLCHFHWSLYDLCWNYNFCTKICDFFAGFCMYFFGTRILFYLFRFNFSLVFTRKTKYVLYAVRVFYLVILEVWLMSFVYSHKKRW